MAKQRQIAEDYMNAWVKHDEDKLKEILAEDAKFHNHPPGVSDDREGEIELSRLFTEAFPDLSVDMGPVIEEENRVAVRFRATGTHKGEFMDMAPSGKKVEVTGIILVTLRDGQVVEDYTEFDALGLLTQLGAVPEMSPAAASTA